MDDNNIKDIEIALRNGLIDEQTNALGNAATTLSTALDVITRQSTMIAEWQDIAQDLARQGKELLALMHKYQDECRSCSNREHHD